MRTGTRKWARFDSPAPKSDGACLPFSRCGRRYAIATYKTPESCYWAFFERFNARDPAGWAGVMSYPHVRVSAGAPEGRRGRFFNPRTAARIYSDHHNYASTAESMGWERFVATGWVRTQGLEPVRVHESDDMVLLAGGWTRRRADGSPIVSNRVLYTLTKLGGSWGIQARFGIDSFEPGSDQESLARAALRSAARRQAARRAGDFESWLDCFHYPLTAVLAPGCVVVAEDSDQLRAQGPIWAGEAGAGQGRTRVIAAGATGALLAQHPEAGSGTGRRAALLARREGAWKTLAVTLLA